MLPDISSPRLRVSSQYSFVKGLYQALRNLKTGLKFPRLVQQRGLRTYVLCCIENVEIVI